MLLSFTQHILYFYIELALIGLCRFLPDKGIPVGISLYLGAINILDFQTDELGIHKHPDYLCEDVVNKVCETIFTKEVDGIVVRGLHAAEPHEVHIPFEELLHLST